LPSARTFAIGDGTETVLRDLAARQLAIGHPTLLA
jgi:hypothetical protein